MFYENFYVMFVTVGVSEVVETLPVENTGVIIVFTAVVILKKTIIFKYIKSYCSVIVPVHAGCKKVFNNGTTTEEM